MRYKEFFRIAIEHEYFASGESAGLAIVPDPSTQRTLQGQRFIIKAMLNSIRVLIPVDETGSAIPLLEPDDLFTFTIFPTSTAFHAVTDMVGLAEGEVFQFTNSGLPENETQLALSVTNVSEVLQGFPLIATAVIQVGDALLDNTNNPTSPQYNIIFNAKAATWRYYFVADPEDADLSIQDVNGQLVFNKVDVQNNTADAIITSLQSNFPDADVSLFESETPIAFRSKAVKGLQLLRHDNVAADTVNIIKHLPNPDTKDIDFKIIKV